MRRSYLIMIVAVAVGVSGLYFGSRGVSGVEQPIAFPHKTHVALDVPCVGCHQGAEKNLTAGRPPTALCLACHVAGESKSPEIAKLKAFGEKGVEIPWHRVWRLPRHVFFSHRIHVARAKLACQSCHGPMETLDRPPPRPLKTLDMDDCIACHLKSMAAAPSAETAHAAEVGIRRRVSDCNACHR